MYEELVKRLREIVPWECFLTCKNTMHEAADVIEGLSNLVDHYGGETGIKNLKEYAIKYWEIVKKEKSSEPYEELIKRLREAPNDWYDADLHYESADIIEELQERVTSSEAIIKRQSDIIKAKDRDLQRMINATSRTFESITNQEAMSRLSPEEFYRKMYWLMFKYGCQFTNTELAVIQWLKQEVEI